LNHLKHQLQIDPHKPNDKTADNNDYDAMMIEITQQVEQKKKRIEYLRMTDMLKELDDDIVIRETKTEKKIPRTKKGTNADSNEGTKTKNCNTTKKDIILDDKSEDFKIEDAETETESKDFTEKDKEKDKEKEKGKGKPEIDIIDDDEFDILDRQYGFMYEDLINFVKTKKANGQYKESGAWRYIRDNLLKTINEREDADKIVNYFCKKCGKKAKTNIKDTLEVIARSLVA